MFTLIGIAFSIVGYIIVSIFMVAGGAAVAISEKPNNNDVQKVETEAKKDIPIIVHKRYKIVDVRNKMNVLISTDDEWEAIDLKKQFRDAGYIVMIEDSMFKDSVYSQKKRR